MMRRLRSTVGAVTGFLLLSSCASISVNSLPQPGPRYPDGYDIVLEFANALNLPDRAKVVMNGTTVGVVDHVDIAGDKVDVTSRIDSKVAVPSNVTAVLQQATVLGDIYVALERPQPDTPAAPALGPGGVVPLAQTTSPPQLEDTIASLANFIASGSIQRAQNTLIAINKVTQSGRYDVRSIASRVASDLSDLSKNIDLVDVWLNGVSGTADVMYNRVPTFKHWFSPAGMLGFDRGLFSAAAMSHMLPSLGSVYIGGFWLVPMLNSLADAMGAIQQGKWSVEDEVPAWRTLFDGYFLPQDKYPAINITSIVGPDGRELIGNVQKVLRILGATP